MVRLSGDVLDLATAAAAEASKKTGFPVTTRQIIEAVVRTALTKGTKS